MEIKHYDKYMASLKSKDRIKAKKYLKWFINSFESFAEKELWTNEHLRELEKKNIPHIRHELFVEIIFPVLLNGYNNKNVHLMLWIVKFIHIFYNHKILWEKINCKDYVTIINECYEIDPDNIEVIRIYEEYKKEKLNDHIGYVNREIDSLKHRLRNSINEYNYKDFMENANILKTLNNDNRYEEIAIKYKEKINTYLKIIDEIGPLELV